MVENKLEEMNAVTDDFPLCFSERVKKDSCTLVERRRVIAFCWVANIVNSAKYCLVSHPYTHPSILHFNLQDRKYKLHVPICFVNWLLQGILPMEDTGKGFEYKQKGKANLVK